MSVICIIEENTQTHKHALNQGHLNHHTYKCFI